MDGDASGSGDDEDLDFCLEEQLLRFQDDVDADDTKGATTAADGSFGALLSSFATLAIPALALAPEVARALERGQNLQRQNARRLQRRRRRKQQEGGKGRPAAIEGNENEAQNAQC